MCGISAVVAHQDIVATLYESIRNLEYRGYDSCGIGVVQNGQVVVRKNTGGVEEVNQKEHLTAMEGLTGIAHTRWATHGRVTQANAHPHLSEDARFSVVHNGIIDNYRELRAEIAAQGVAFLSETDTEVLPHLMALTYERTGSVEEAFVGALERVQGTYALAMVSALEPGRIYCGKVGSPLVIGLGQGRNFVASDINAFLPFTREAVVLQDGEYGVVTADGLRLHRLAPPRPAITRAPMHIEWDAETSRKGGYSHYMLKEIFDQPQTVLNALGSPQEDIETLAASVGAARQTYLMGVGTTFYVAMLGQYFFSRWARRYLPAVSSDEFTHLAVPGPEDLLISISQSGETYDTRQGVKYAQERGARTASIVNVVGSSLSMMTDQVILQGSGPEICVVSTKAALAQMVILLRVALALGRQEGHVAQAAHGRVMAALEALPATVETTLNELSGFVRNLANRTAEYPNWLMMGRGPYYPIAMEAALKLKEVSYLHVEGLPAGFLKHGTLAMVDEHMMSLFLVPTPAEGELHQQTLSAIEEVKARGGPVIGFCCAGDARALALLDHAIEMPQLDPAVAPFMSLIVAQLFSYFVALKLGRSIDKPRNLAKSVTVG